MAPTDEAFTMSPCTPTADDHLYALLQSCAEALHRAMTHDASQGGVALADFHVLRVLVVMGSPQAPSEIADTLGYSRAYITKIVQRLVTAGHVREHQSSIFTSRKTLELTDSGREACIRAAENIQPGHYFEGLTERQRKQLGNLLALLRDRMPLPKSSMAGSLLLEDLLAAESLPRRKPFTSEPLSPEEGVHR
jgi:DNA-binding MarR family transcriptional regulator